LSNIECREDDVELDTKWYLEILCYVLHVKGKKIRICAWMKRWWKREMKERRSTLGREKRKERSC